MKSENYLGFNTVNGKRVHATMKTYKLINMTPHRFNTVNGKRVHATEKEVKTMKTLRSFNTVNGKRVHATQVERKRGGNKMFQYRKR